MTNCIEKPRYVCALGAFQSVLAINRAVPILHSGPGCGAKLDGGLGTLNGSQGAGYINPHILPCTNIGEEEVIFGGNNRLHEIIENALKIYDADLFVVLTGCTSEIVGDDISEVVSHFSDNEKPVIFAETAGFKGSNIIGHEIIMDAIIDQYLKPPDKINEKQVNIWASIPFFNPFWAGDYLELEKLIRDLGLVPNIIFGPNGGIKELDKVPQAAFNLLVSPWAGLGNVEHLKERFNTPYLHYPVLPVGPTETGRFIHKVAEFAGIPLSKAEAVIKKNEKNYYYFIERASDELLKTRLLPRRFYTLADSTYALGISKFLANDMGLLPEVQFITDNAPEQFRKFITEEFNNLNTGITTEIEFVPGSGYAQDKIKNRKHRSVPLILGSGWEGTFSRNLKAFYIPFAMPLLDRMVLNRSYVGYNGALTLLEDICSVVLSSYQ